MDAEGRPDLELLDIEIVIDVPELDLGGIDDPPEPPPDEPRGGGGGGGVPQFPPEETSGRVTVAIIVVLLGFGGLAMVTLSLGRESGQAGAWVVAGLFTLLYMVVFVGGARFIGRRRS